MNKYKQGDSITFNLNETVTGLSGRICGKLGPIIIVELSSPIKGYEFTHIYITDVQVIEQPKEN